MGAVEIFRRSERCSWRPSSHRGRETSENLGPVKLTQGKNPKRWCSYRLLNFQLAFPARVRG
jgi:hypothetical protein